MKFFTMVLIIGSFSTSSVADPFGACACNTDMTAKIQACAEAQRRTDYPAILHWVHREMARALVERGNFSLAVMHYELSLNAKSSDHVQLEMEDLVERTK